MNYELAKQLKKAGFPQPTLVNPITGVVGREVLERRPYEPTLSELIDTCGDNFVALSKMGEDWYCAENGVPVRLIANESKTPEEAVAKLWLALNKK